MTFRELEIRLLDRLRQKVRQGEISERQLARRTGYTQPHIHNVLKGARKLNRHLADAMLTCLPMSVEDLLKGTALAQFSATHIPVPLWRGVVGPRHRLPDPDHPRGYHLFPASFLSRFGEPALLEVGAEEEAMSPLIEPGDIVLLDRAETVRRRPVFDAIYVLFVGGFGALCRCQLVGSALVLVMENARRSFRTPEYLPLNKRDILDVVKGRVVWACREFDLDLP